MIPIEKPMTGEEFLKEREPYVDKTGTMDKPDPMRDVYHEFPHAMMLIAQVTAMGHEKHPPRSWRTFPADYAFAYHMGKAGRHLLKLETEGVLNYEDMDRHGKPVNHVAQAVWNLMGWLDHWAVENKQKEDLKATPIAEFSDDVDKRSR